MACDVWYTCGLQAYKRASLQPSAKNKEFHLFALQEMGYPVKLTEQAQTLLSIIENSPTQPVSRKYISDQLDKKQLNAADLALLDMMALNGYVEKVKEDSRTPTGFKWEYRFIKPYAED